MEIYNIKHDQFYQAEIEMVVSVRAKINNQKQRNPNCLGVAAVAVANMEKVLPLFDEDFSVDHVNKKLMIPRAYDFELPAEFKLGTSVNVVCQMFQELRKLQQGKKQPLIPGVDKYM